LARAARTIDPMSLPPPRFFSSTQLVGIAGTTRKTLRVLESHGLIKPTRTSGKRRYSQDCLRRLWLIEVLREAGISLPRIATLMAHVDGAPTGGEAASELHETLGEAIEKIDSKVRDLALARDALVTARQTLATKCSGCSKPISDCEGCASNGRLDVVSAQLLTKAGRVTRGD
jgi:DNA-binding transcriptional MerR regulator